MAALFGAKKRGSIFSPGVGMDSATPPIAVQQDRMGETLGMAAQAPRSGLGTRLLGQGWEDKVFALGGLLQGDTRGVEMMQQARAMQQQQAAALAADQRKRSLDMADWTAKEQWKLDHPAPVNNDTVNDFNWYKGLSPEDRALYEQMRPEYRQGPDGQYYRVQKAIPAPAGVTFTPLGNGGPTPPASGTFR